VQAQPPALHPLSIDPGATGDITVTITPVGTRGTVVRGWLYVNALPMSNRAGDELNNITYTYTVG
jgi:hypothetical protein